MDQSLQQAKKQKLDEMTWRSPVEEIIFGTSLKTTDSNVVAEALGKLGDLITDEEETIGDLEEKIGHPFAKKNRSVLCGDAGFRFIACAMEQFQDHANVQEQGCRTLANALHDIPSSRASAKLSDVVLRCFDAITTAMEKHEMVLDVQYEACVALANAFVELSNAKHIVGSGGIEKIIRTMNNFPNDAEVIEHACFAIDNLSELKSFNDRIRDAGGLEAIAVAARKYWKETGGAEKAIILYARAAALRLYKK